MRAMQNRSCLLKLSLLVGVLTGCLSIPPNEPIETVNQVINDATSTSSIATETAKVFPSTLTPVPTIDLEDANNLEGLLNDPTCVLPCYLGIHPGETSIADAQANLTALGATFAGTYFREEDSALYHSYNLALGEYGVAPTESENKGVKYPHRVELITNNDTVQILEVFIGGKYDLESFRTIWSRYLARQIMLQLGQPEKIYIDPVSPLHVVYGRNIWLIYEAQGILAEIYGQRQDNHICPEHEATFVGIHLSLFTTDSEISIYSDQRIPPTEYPSIETVLGINAEEFYESVISDPAVCYVPIDN